MSKTRPGDAFTLFVAIVATAIVVGGIIYLALTAEDMVTERQQELIECIERTDLMEWCVEHFG